MSEIVPIFLKNKFLSDFQRAERELTQKLPHHHSQFQDIKNVLERNIVVPSMLTDATALLHDLNDTLADCVTFLEQRKSHKTKPFSLADNSFRRKIQKQLHQINAKLQGIRGGGNANAAQGELLSSRSSLEIDRSLESVLYDTYDEYEIHGFDQQLEKIVELLGDGRKAIGIVGIGGSGKTALAQMLFKIVVSPEIFEVGYWVNLSHHVARPEDTYDDFKNRVLIKCVIYDTAYTFDSCSIEEMLEVSKARECLIVLDGAKHISHWYREYFLRSDGEGLVSGSAVIVTSTLQEVAEGMVGYRNLYHMQPISEPEKIWLIFQDKVKKNGLMDASHPSLLRMKEEIVERCYGLPLAAKTLADIIPKRIYEVDYELSEKPDIIPRFLRNKFINDFQEAERGLRQKLPSHSQFQEIKNVVEHNIITTSMLNEAKTLLYTLNETLTDCVTFCEQRKAHKRKPFSWEESSFLRKIQKQLNQIKMKLSDIKESDANTTPSSLLPLSSLSEIKDNEEIELVNDEDFEIYGFDQQVEKILELLRERKAIGIVGIGGSGKTTLAKMVVKKVLREKRFEVVYWVILRYQVEQPEDPHDDNKTTVLLELVRRSDGLWDAERYDCSIKEMWDKVSNAASKTTKCLIVLDGAKNISDWYKEGSTHLFNESAFIVTSRLQEVAEGMVGMRNLFHMQPISDPEDIWSIFQDAVRKNGFNPEYSTLLRMKDEIVEQCYGLPLAAKTLAEIISRQIYELDEKATKLGEKAQELQEFPWGQWIAGVGRILMSRMLERFIESKKLQQRERMLKRMLELEAMEQAMSEFPAIWSIELQQRKRMLEPILKLGAMRERMFELRKLSKELATSTRAK